MSITTHSYIVITFSHILPFTCVGAFGSVAWNTAEDKIVYVAEKKKVESASYFAKPSKCQDNPPEPVSLHTCFYTYLLILQSGTAT